MATLHEWLDLAGALRRRGRDPLPERLVASSVILLDTEIGSENSGDHIIMQACDDVCREVFGAAGGLASWVERPYECDIRLPERAIARWKAQFSS